MAHLLASAVLAGFSTVRHLSPVVADEATTTLRFSSIPQVFARARLVRRFSPIFEFQYSSSRNSDTSGTGRRNRKKGTLGARPFAFDLKEHDAPHRTKTKRREGRKEGGEANRSVALSADSGAVVAGLYANNLRKYLRANCCWQEDSVAPFPEEKSSFSRGFSRS